ncbi:MAG: hypothetical protein HYW49_09120 [Deltaproteobacteria bacterium]|nr:hypothetical protein [Deltaproteobacteria bacterium]
MASPITCPQCGRAVESITVTPVADAPVPTANPAPPPPMDPEKLSQPSAQRSPACDWLTLNLKIACGPAQLRRFFEDSTLSFGPEGFSIVSDGGRSLKKISYASLSGVRSAGNCVLFEHNGADSVLEFKKGLFSRATEKAKLLGEVIRMLAAPEKRGKIATNPFSPRIAQDLRRKLT